MHLHRAAVRNFPICCVDVVVHHRGRALLIRRKEEPAGGLWWLPGGRLFKNERLDAAARRKAREETGLDVDVVRRIGTYETWFPTGPAPRLTDGYHNISTAFLVRLRGEALVRPDPTASAFRWIERVEPGLDPYVRRVLQDARVFGAAGAKASDARVWSHPGRSPGAKRILESLA